MSVGTFFKRTRSWSSRTTMKTFADLKSKTVLVSTDGQTNWWPWAKAKYGFRMSRPPYTFNVQPFVANKNFAQQGYVTSETLAVQRGGRQGREGIPARRPRLSALHRDHHAAEEDDRRQSQDGRVICQGDDGRLERVTSRTRHPANAPDQKDNPAMTDELLAYGLQKMKEMASSTAATPPGSASASSPKHA